MKKVDLKYMPLKTKKVFERLSLAKFIKQFTLVGGTALSVQIKHRLSEDLDFIYDGEELNINLIKRNIHKFFDNYKIIRQNYNDQIDFIIDETKVTFFSTATVVIPFKVMDYSFLFQNINIADIVIIATLKLNAISHRNTIRDYYDLYYISRHYLDLLSIINTAKKLLPNLSPITYTETLVYIDDIDENNLSEHIQAAEEKSKKDIADFFKTELRKIKGQL